MMGLDSLDRAFGGNPNKPSEFESCLFLFFEQGIGLERFVDYPIPYIISVLKVKSYVIEEERKAAKKAAKR